MARLLVRLVSLDVEILTTFCHCMLCICWLYDVLHLSHSIHTEICVMDYFNVALQLLTHACQHVQG